jgi:hypothetical protein
MTPLATLDPFELLTDQAVMTPSAIAGEPILGEAHDRLTLALKRFEA